MKPRTRIQKEVHALMCDLPSMTREQKQFAKGKLFTSHLYKTKKTTDCLDCGHRWENTDGYLLTTICGDVCPKCGAKLKAMDTPRKRTNRQDKYICQSLTVQGFQVFRFFYVEKTSKVGQATRYFFCEVGNHWIREDGKVVMCSIKYNPMGYSYRPQWCWGSDIEIRNNNDNYYILPHAYFPNKRVTKRMRRNGYHRTFHRLQPTYFSELILGDSKAETLLKSKQIEIFNGYYNLQRNVVKYWPSIKIAIRHHYTISHPSDWFDHLDILAYFRKDILNPSVICMEDFRTEHQRLNDRKNAIDAKRRYEEEKERAIQADENYLKSKRAYLNLSFTKGNLSVAPLANVQEFYEEGEALHHCIGRYHTKEESLILSAKLQGRRTETVEVSLDDFTVVQSRGLQNKSTKHHKEIISLVEKNLPKIKKASKIKAKAV